MLFRDGVGGWGLRQSGVYLNPSERKAFIFQEQVSRTGLLVNNDFNLPADVFITELRQNSLPQNAYYRILQHTYNGDWFSNRKVQAQLLVRILPSRSRIDLISGNLSSISDQITVISSFSTPLEYIAVFGPGSRCWEGKNIEVGKASTLKATHKESCKAAFARFTREAGPIIRNSMTSLGYSENSFAAIAAQAADYTIDTLPSVKWKSSEASFFGPLSRGE